MRQRWREAAEPTLLHRHDTQRFLPALQQLITQPETTWTEAQRQQFAARRVRTQQLLLNLAQTLTERQRQHLAERTGLWAADFERLACGAGQATRQVRAAGSAADFASSLGFDSDQPSHASCCRSNMPIPAKRTGKAPPASV